MTRLDGPRVRPQSRFLHGIGGFAKPPKLVLPSCAALLFVLSVLMALSDASAARRTSSSARSSSAIVSVIVILREQADVGSVAHGNRAARLNATIRALQATALKTQANIRAFLAVGRAQGAVSRVEPFWIFNGLAVTATLEVVHQLAARPDVQSVTPDRMIPAPAPNLVGVAPEPNISLVEAPALWNLGYQGQGVVVANMDTGVDATHPDLASRWRGGTNSWYDPNGQHPTTPTDVNGHGTQTMGVMVGGGGGGTSIGIAPEARWIAAKIFNDQGKATTSGIHQGFQWLLDPDGNPNTADAPNVVNNSWAISGTSCSLDFQTDLRSLRAAGILPVFAAGNSGPSASTSVSPANNPEAFAVGATDTSDTIFSGSSRGPSACGEPPTVFPELVAPGVNILSSDLYGGYITSTGTSLAAPHVAGVLALLLSARPNASPEQQANALERGAVDLGGAGADNTFGYGRLDALAAYTWLGSHPDFTLTTSPFTASALPGGDVMYTVSVTPANGFASDVALSLAGLSSSQASWTFTPAIVTGGSGSSQLRVTTVSSLPPGSYPLTIAGTSGGLVRSTTVTLVVNAPPPPDFAISVSPSSRSVSRGGSTTYTVSVSALNGFAGQVALALSGLPRGSTATFGPSLITGAGTSTLTVRTSRFGPRGTFTLTLKGTSGSLTHQATTSFVVS